MYHLKKKVTNKACVEGLIFEAYIVGKSLNFFVFCILYFDTKVVTNRIRIAKNDDEGVDSKYEGSLSIFKY